MPCGDRAIEYKKYEEGEKEGQLVLNYRTKKPIVKQQKVVALRGDTFVSNCEKNMLMNGNVTRRFNFFDKRDENDRWPIYYMATNYIKSWSSLDDGGHFITPAPPGCQEQKSCKYFIHYTSLGPVGNNRFEKDDEKKWPSH